MFHDFSPSKTPLVLSVVFAGNIRNSCLIFETKSAAFEKQNLAAKPGSRRTSFTIAPS